MTSATPEAIMKKRALLVVLLLAVSFTGTAQQKNGIDFTPLACIRAGELALLQLKVVGPGELRAYFRRINTTDWCSVEGTNEGPLSRAVLPKFDAGDEIEYFFVLLDGRRVVTRSSMIYRSRITEDCESPFARHVLRLSMSCGDDATGLPTFVGIGVSPGKKVAVSPFQPE
jgi:hypothetical protein